MWTAFTRAIVLYLQLAYGTYTQGRTSLGRLTWKRGLIMTAFLPLYILVQLTHWFFFFLDELLFPGYRRVKVKEPLFVIGVPRSGTTFLHRLLASDEERFTTTALWELVFAPSICERMILFGLGRVDHAIGRPGGRLIEFIERKTLGSLDDIHGTGLRDPEEDYFFLAPMAACFLMVFAFPHEELIWRMSRFDTDVPEADKKVMMRFYEAMVTKHLYVYGPEKQYLSKNPSFSSLANALREKFPDCKIISCSRTPYKVVPSLLSGMMLGAEVFGNDTQGHQYRDQLLAMLKFYYHHLAENVSKMPEDSHAFVLMNELAKEPKATVVSLYERFGWNLSPEYAARLDEEDSHNRTYKSQHKYTLAKFGLTPEEVREGLEDIFEFHGFDLEPPAGA